VIYSARHMGLGIGLPGERTTAIIYQFMAKHPTPNDNDSLRLDKWLWAARFFKTRSLASEAISGGKVHLDGQRIKPARQVRPGMELRIRQGDSERAVTILALNHQRRPAKEAVLLYQETAQSIADGAQRAATRAAAGKRDSGAGRPTKRDRRQLQRLKH